MAGFWPVFSKILSLYLLVVAGYFAGRRLKVRKEGLASLLIYLLTPVVVCEGALKAPLEAQYLGLPFFGAGMSLTAGLLVLWLARKFFVSPNLNLLCFACVSANSGFLGIPVGLALFGSQALSAIVVTMLGMNLIENTFGLYLFARGSFSVRQSLIKVARLPVMYAFAAGLLLNFMKFTPSQAVSELMLSIRGCYSVLGIMLIGLALADLKTFRIEVLLDVSVIAAKFVLWPLLALSIITIDAGLLHILQPETRQILFYMGTLPPAAITVAYATEFGVLPDKAAVTILLPTLLALVIIPLLNLAVFP